MRILGEDLVIFRDKSGRTGLLADKCAHRSASLVYGRVEERGISCAYHGWRYGIDGSLEYAQDPETFPQGCPKEKLGLRPVRCERWGGFVFINLNPDAEPLHEYLGEIPEHLDPYHFEEMKILDDWTVEIECNWKTSVDASTRPTTSPAPTPTP